MHNGHVYIQLMKQHTLQNAYFLGYSRKTDFLMLRQHEISYFDVRITAVALQTTRQICTEVFVGLPCKFSPRDYETKFRITAKQPSPFSGYLPLVHFLHFFALFIGRSKRFLYAPKCLKWPCRHKIEEAMKMLRNAYFSLARKSIRVGVNL